MIYAIILGLLACVGIPATYILALTGRNMLAIHITIAVGVLWALSMLAFAGVLIYWSLT